MSHLSGDFQKAVVKKLQKYFHRPEGVPLQETGAEFKVEVSILKDKATVLIDTQVLVSLSVAIVLIKVGHLLRKIWRLLSLNLVTGIRINR